MPSEAVLFRKIDAVSPTLMLDEADAIFDRSNGSTEPLRALLNASNRRGTFVPRCVGPRQQLVDFAIFSAKVLAGIGDFLPETVRDRSIVLRLERKRPDESARRFRRREALELAEPIAQELASWAQDAVADLEAARPRMPDVLDDRAEEAWEPLFAIADLAGGNWPERAGRPRSNSLPRARPRTRHSARGSSATFAALFDVKRRRPLLLRRPRREPERVGGVPWGDIRGKGARPLARSHDGSGGTRIRPRTIRLEDGSTPKGYLARTVPRRVLPLSRRFGAPHRHNPHGYRVAAIREAPHVAEQESRKPASVNDCGDVAADSSAEPRGRRDRSTGGHRALDATR